MDTARTPKKHRPLSEEDLASFTLEREALRYLEDFATSRGLTPAEVTVLDYGTGRGRTVAALRELGYQAFGVDIDPLAIDAGSSFFRVRYPDAGDVLSVLPADGRIPHPDGRFDFVFSDQVLEHVADIEGVVRELSRVTSAGGVALHRFPGALRPVEVHLRMPFVHWLPKNGLRKAAIAACVRLGVHPGWPELEGESASRRADVYYRYSVDHTFYRSARAVRRVFEAHGFEVSFVTADNEALHRNPAVSTLLGVRWIRELASWLLVTFRLVELKASKAVRSGIAPSQRTPGSSRRSPA